MIEKTQSIIGQTFGDMFIAYINLTYVELSIVCDKKRGFG